MKQRAIGWIGVVVVLVILGSCATGADSAGGGDRAGTSGGTGDGAAGEGARRDIDRPYSPWPVSVDRGFQEGAVVSTAGISFSHAPGWYFASSQPTEGPIGGDNGPAASDVAFVVRIADTAAYFDADVGQKLSTLQGGTELYGSIVRRPWSPETVPTRPDTADPRTSAIRYLQWLEQIPGEVVWSDESVAGGSGSTRRPLFLALVEERSGEVLHALAWTHIDDAEVVVRMSGPAQGVRNNLPDLIRLVKTLAPAGAEGDRRGNTPAGAQAGTVAPPSSGGSSGSGGQSGPGGPGGGPTTPTASFRRIPEGLQFSDPTGAWRWSRDLVDGFVVARTDPSTGASGTAGTGGSSRGGGGDTATTPGTAQNEAVEVAMWADGDGFAFQPLSEGIDEAAVRRLLQENVSLRRAVGAGPLGDAGTQGGRR